MLFGDLLRRSASSARRAGVRPRRSDATAFHGWSSSAVCPSARTAQGCAPGYVAGDAALIKAFLLYRTYHGSAMSPAVAAASIAAWNDEAHVRANRALYAQKFAAAGAARRCSAHRTQPEAAFYLWANVGGDDADFARRFYADQAVSVLPGSYLGRTVGGVNPGAGYIRIALVAESTNAPKGSTGSSGSRAATRRRPVRLRPAPFYRARARPVA